MPDPTRQKKKANNWGLSTCFSKMASGKLRAVTAIIKESAVPIDTPALVNSLTRGITPAALEYKGIPSKTAIGTANGLSRPAYCASVPAGIHP